MTPFGPTIRRLLLDPATLLFGAATFALVAAVEVPAAAGVANAEIWSGVAVTAHAFGGLALTYWVVRVLAGNATGRGQFWKWLGYTLGVGLVTLLPSLIVGYFVGGFDNDRPLGWAEALVGVLVAVATCLLWVRVDALAISGDRIRFNRIRGALSSRISELLLWFFCASVVYWGSELALSAPDVTEALHPVAIALTKVAGWTFGTSLSIVVSVAAYLAVDRSSDYEGARDVFG